MLIATIVFGPMIGAAAVAAIGRIHEKAGEIAALFVTVCALGLSIAAAGSAGTGTLYPSAGEAAGGLSFVIPGILSGSGLTFSVTPFRAAYAVITALMWVGTTMFSPEYFAHERENLGRYRFFVLFTLGAVERKVPEVA